MKQKISVVLAIILLLNCWVPAMVSRAAESTTTTLVTPKLKENSGAQDDNTRKRYVINIGFTGVSDLPVIEDIPGTVLVNGVERKITWSGWTEGSAVATTDHYGLCVPYSVCSRVGFDSDAAMKEIIYNSTGRHDNW